MKWKYSIVQISPNPELGDSISVGILFQSQNTLYFKYFQQIILAASKLFPSQVNLIIKTLKSFDKSLSKLEKSEISLFNSKHLRDDPSDLLSYLNIYSNGIIKFSHPKPVLINNNLSLDELAFSLLNIEKKSNVEKERFDYKSVVKDKLYTPLREKVHTDITLAKNLIPDFFFEIHFDILGQNGNIISAKVIDFELQPDTIVKHLSNFDTALSILQRKVKNKNPQSYVLGIEPEVINSEQHSIWDTINKSGSMFMIVHPDDSDTIVENVLDSNAKKFLSIKA